MFGCKARLPVDVAFGLPGDQPVSTSQDANRLHQQLRKAYAQVRYYIDLHLYRHKEIYDRKVHGKAYQEGNQVWLNVPVRPRGLRKLHKPWAEPYKVCKKLSDVTYCIQNVKNKRNQVVVHFDRLKRFTAHEGTSDDYGSPVQPSEQQQPEFQHFGDNLELCDADDDDDMINL